MPTRRLNRIHFLIFITICLGLLSGATVGIFLALTRDLPQIRELENFEPSAVTRIYSADQTLLGELFIEKRTVVPIHQIPADLISALVTIEDRQFYTHSGIDLKGILRAIVKDILAGRFAEGASTITQQLAKTLFLTREKTLTRKFKEAILAIQLERRYTKNEILALYLNQIYLGSGAYGVEAAAQRYFGKTASQMNLSQCALIAGLPKAPSRYSPLNNPELATQRRDLVLRVMRRQGLIDDHQYQQAINSPVRADGPDATTGEAPYFIQYIKPVMESAVGPGLLYKGGLAVHTTLSYRLQQAARQALGKGLRQIGERRRRQNPTAEDPQGALVAIDVKTGGVLAMVGGADFSKSKFNRAVDAHRQPGSAFKPIVYALAITQGFDQSSLVLDAPVIFKAGRDGKDWQPENAKQRYQGEMTLRYALAHSKNIPAVRLVERLGPSAVVQFAHQMGIDTSLSPNLSIALGTSATALIDLTAAYAVFPNAGNYISPFGVSDILDRDSITHWQVKPAVRPVLSEAQAAIMVDMLQGVIREGTGQAARGLNIPLAGKTGTTNDYRDALFVGFSPRVATGVWVGMDDFSPLGDMETGARAALPIWINFMAVAGAKGGGTDFAIPEGMRTIRINPLSGRKAEPSDQAAVSALFMSGTGPDD